MSERENNVYKAKLAEQAERYDGKTTNPKISNFLCVYGTPIGDARFFQ